MENIVIAIAGMSCRGCVKTITSVLEALPGVAEVEVSLADGTASIVYDPGLARAEDFADAIEGAGFQAN